MNSIIDIVGTVSSCLTESPLTFKVRWGEQIVTVLSAYPLPVRAHDRVVAKCKLIEENKYEAVEPPYVEIGMSEPSIIASLSSAGRITYAEASAICADLKSRDKVLNEYFGKLADLFVRQHDTTVAILLAPMTAIGCGKFLRWWYVERSLRRLKLLSLTEEEVKLSSRPCDELYQLCMRNPYIIPCIPIEKADSILQRLGRPIDIGDRYCGMIVRTIWRNLYTSGWVGTPSHYITRQYPEIGKYIELLKQEYEYVGDMSTVYLRYPYTIECAVTDMIVKLRQADVIEYDTPLGILNGRPTPTYTLELSSDQTQAVQGALDHTISIITGGPGTGKSTVVGQIIHNLKLRQVSYCVCSYTGKAVARIQEITGTRDAATMHRLIGGAGKSESAAYTTAIIDEVSMVTTELFHDFYRAYPSIEQFILVGDIDQLAPIAWGTLLSELIKSQCVPTYYLVQNHRTYVVPGEIDGVTLNARSIVRHDLDYPFEFTPTSNFILYNSSIGVVDQIVQSCHASGILDTGLTIITPYRRCLDHLNSVVQRIYNLNEASVTDSRGVTWRINDRVMLITNDYDIEFFNGEEGKIVAIDAEKVSVKFSGSTEQHDFNLEYKGNRSMEEKRDISIERERTVLKLKHSFAITSDKSQGSEWDFVVIYIPDDARESGFLNRNRLYTAITRARRCVWLVGNIAAFEKAAVRPSPYRCENLANRLKLALPVIGRYIDPALRADIEAASFEPSD
jgi:exodeoxyribonuclease V alpha subunit